MVYYDEKLRELHEKMSRQKQLDAMLTDLYDQQRQLKPKVEELAILKASEQADVDKLEGRTLAAFFYEILGKKNDKLTKEKREALEAAVKYDAAARELAAVESDILRYRSELQSLKGCEAEYARLIQEKSDIIKNSGRPEAAEILRTEERIAQAKSQLQEIGEAISAGKSALRCANNVMNSLDSAEGWGTWDMLGGGLLSDMAKYSHLDDAQASIEQLQVQLRRFKTELADVTIQANFSIQVGEFLRFADYFFDNIFTDWAVMDRISQAKRQVSDTQYQLNNVLNRLNSMARTQEDICAREQQKLDELVLGTKM